MNRTKEVKRGGQGFRNPLASLLKIVRSLTPFYGKFLPLLPEGSSLLDVGCGDCCSLRIIAGIRPDLRFYGVDIEKSRGCEDFLSGFCEADLNREPIDFRDGFFDGVRICHLLEHLTDLSLLRREIPRLLKPGGWVYVEAPNLNSLKVPSFSIFREQGGCFNFADDPSHVRPLSTEDLSKFLLSCGFDVIGSRVIRNPLKILLSPGIVTVGMIWRKRAWLTDAVWEITGWCSCAIGRKPIGSCAA